MPRLPLFVITVLLTGLLAEYLHRPLEQFRLPSPDGQYTAIVSTPRLWHLLQGLPGLGRHAGDRSGAVEIRDSAGVSLGSIPLAKVSQANDLQWIRFGARIRLVGAWNFQDGFYAYWNERRTHVITQQIN
jgi:hypothetical protein